MQNALGKKIDAKNVKIIEYVEKMGADIFPGQPHVENDNVERKYAFAYYDEGTNTKCLYFHNKGEEEQIIVQDSEGNIEVN